MKILLICTLCLLLFACNDAKKDSLQLQTQQRQIDSLKATVHIILSKAERDSIRRSKIAFWKKQTTLMTVNLYADKATLSKAQQTHRGRSPAERKKAIAEANMQLAQDKKRARQVSDSLRKYED